MKKVTEASMAVAEAVKLCRPKVIPVYPITPQTRVPEALAGFINDGELNAEVIYSESEHSALSSGIGAQATGVRTFTATSSQGLALMWEVLYIASGLRLPIVMVNVNRTLSAPINIWNDHQDAIGARDSGWIQLYVESAQEALDTVIMAYKIAEDKSVLLPVMVCLDGFTLSHVYEPVDVPEQDKVDKFLPAYKPAFKLDTAKPITIGPIGFPNIFMEFKKMQQEAMEASAEIIKKVNKDFNKSFGRKYGDGLIETYKIESADYALLGMGTICGTSRSVVDSLRKKGKKVGLIKLKCFRPFPFKDIQSIAKRLKGIAVVDRSISLGYEGALFTEVKSALKNMKVEVDGFIAGLGGRDVTPKHIERALLDIGKTKKTEWLL